MLRHRNARRLLGGVLVTVGLLSMALPAHAGTVTVSDPGGDTLDPILTQNDQTTFHAPAPSADITSSTLTGNTNGSLTASITVAGTIPPEGSTDPTAYQGPKATGAVATGPSVGFRGGLLRAILLDPSSPRATAMFDPPRNVSGPVGVP